MKYSIKVAAMALIAMFAFSTAADAQLGGLLNKAKRAISSQQQSEQTVKAVEEKGNVGVMKPYDPDAELPKNPIARTIFTLPGTEQKMMIDYTSSDTGWSDKYIDGFWSVEALEEEGWLKWQMKPEALDKARVLELFNKRFGNSAKRARVEAKYAEEDTKFMIGNIGTETTSWQYRRDDWGNIVCRYVVLMVVMEFEDGENLICRYEAKQDHISGEAFDEDGMTVGFVNGQVSGIKARVVNGWEVKTDCFTSNLKQ